MKLDIYLHGQDLRDMPAIARSVEDFGFDGLWVPESASNGFLPMVLAAEHTRHLEMGTNVAIAFARSPTVLAHIGWDLARYSHGRFIMGLGSQVRAHNERRLGVKWERPLRKMRETIEAMRAVWDCWKTGNRLNYQGEFFKLDLMTPFFAGLPSEVPPPPVYISAVNEGMLRVAGQVCDGVQLHPVHSVKYLRDYAWPHLRAGMAAGGRTREAFTAAASVFVIPTDGVQSTAHHEQYVRRQLAFYMSTPAYRVVLDQHGWAGVGEQLSQLMRRGDTDAMAKLVSDEMLAEFAVTGKWSELAGRVKARYAAEGLVDRVNYYTHTLPEQDQAGWRAALAAFRD
ncbi:MAG: TIGR03617 family F420-dependent LLM class oxidoreductase [Gammaproteobacteria bacterium]